MTYGEDKRTDRLKKKTFISALSSRHSTGLQYASASLEYVASLASNNIPPRGDVLLVHPATSHTPGSQNTPPHLIRSYTDQPSKADRDDVPPCLPTPSRPELPRTLPVLPDTLPSYPVSAVRYRLTSAAAPAADTRQPSTLDWLKASPAATTSGRERSIT